MVNRVLLLLVLTLVPSLVVADEAPPHFLLRWGSNGTGPGQFRNATAMAFDGSGVLHVVDGNNGRVQKFDSSGEHLGTYASGAGGARAAIAFGPSGNAYVAGGGGATIGVEVFDANGTFLGRWGSTGSGPGQFEQPYGVAVDDNEFVYVSDDYNHRIQKFTATGTLVASWIPPASKTGSRGLWGLWWRDGVLHSIDPYSGDRILKFDAMGNVIGEVVCAGSGITKYVAMDSAGNFFMPDQTNNVVRKYSPQGVLLSTWGRFGVGDGEFVCPTGVAVDDRGDIYVSQTGDVCNGPDRVQKFGYGVTPVLRTTWGRIKTIYR